MVEDYSGQAPSPCASRLKTMAHPLGRKLESHTKTLINRRFPRFSVKSPNIGGDLVGVDVSFRSFLCARENEHMMFHCFSQKQKNSLLKEKHE